MVDAPPAPDLAYLFRRIAYAICEVVADHIRRDRHSGPMLEAITVGLFSKMRRFDALFARFRAGAVFPPLRRHRGASAADTAAVREDGFPATPEPVPVPEPVAKPAPMPAAGAAAPGYARKVLPNLPRKRGWLTTMMPWVVALYAIRLRAYVEDAGTAAFLAACPQARALLRDLWWALSSDPLPEGLRPDPLPLAVPVEAEVLADVDGGQASVPKGWPDAPSVVGPRRVRSWSAMRSGRRSFSPG